MALSLRQSSREKALAKQVNELERREYERVSSPIVQHADTTFVGFSSGNAQATLAAIRGTTAAAIRVIRERVQGLEIGVFTRRFVNGELEDTPAFSHPLQRLLNNPTLTEEGTITHTAEQIWGLVTTHTRALGESYLIVLHDGAGIPRGLQVAVPGTIEPILSGGGISGYRIVNSSGNAVGQVLKPEDVIRFWEPDPFDLFAAIGIMQRSSDLIETDQAAVQRWRKFYINDATPKLAFVAKDGSEPFPNADQQASVAKTWARRFNRLTGTWKLLPAWVKPGWDIKQLSSEEEAASGVTMMTHTRRKVLEQFGVPPSKIGDVVDANRAAAESNNFTFDTNTIEPITSMIADAITAQLASQYPNPSDTVQLIVKYRPFIARDKAFELMRDESDLKTKLRSIDEVRANREPELNPVSWGALPVGSIADVPYTGEEEDIDLSAFNLSEPTQTDEEIVEANPAVDEEEEPRQRAMPSLRKLRVHFSAEAEWERVLRRDATFTPRFRSRQRSIFQRQGEITLERFLEQSRSAGGLNLGPPFPPAMDGWERAAGDDLAADLFPLDGWQDLFRITTEPVRSASFIASATEATQAITGNVFRMTDVARETLNLLDTAHYAFVNESTQGLLAQELGAGIEAGESIDQMARRISETFGTRKQQSTRIARTEVASAVQSAQVQGYRQTGVVEQKMWNTSLDGDVRDSHTIEGQTVALDDSFTLDNGAQARAPADAALEAGDRINCRCFVSPVFIDEDPLDVIAGLS